MWSNKCHQGQRHWHQSYQAFSLIEVLVAMAILAGGILGVMGAFSLASRTGTDAFRHEEAASLAQRELGLAITTPKSQWAERSGTTGHYQWTVRYDDKSHELGMASVAVRWLDSGSWQEFRLSRVFVPQAGDSGQ